MSKFGIGQPVGRVEDRRFLTGHGRYVDDINLDGQLVTGSYMDYRMPRAADVPMIDFHIKGIPTSTNPPGMKGCGEAGSMGSIAAVANAVRDARAPAQTRWTCR